MRRELTTGLYARNLPITNVGISASRRIVAAVLLFVAGSIAANAAELNRETVARWNEYVEAQTARLAEHSSAGSFLWSDRSADRMRRLRNGEILVAPMGENPKTVPYGLIHHWIGAIFLPDATLENVVTLVRDYDRYREFYAPAVVDSRLLRHMDTEDSFSLRMLSKAALASIAVSADFESSYTRLDENRMYSVGYSTRVREIDKYGQTDQHEMPPDTGHGFIWRLYNVARFEKRDGGVYIELEAVALSRDVPAALRWVVNPVVRRVSKSSMLVSLQKTQEAVLSSDQLATRAVRRDDVPEQRTKSNAFVSRKAFVPGGGD